MAVSVSIDSITQVPGQNQIAISYTATGTGIGYVSVFFRHKTSPYAQIRVFRLSGDHGAVTAGTKTVYWDSPHIEYGTYEGSLVIGIVCVNP